VKILVTGGAGFVGCVLTPLLVNKGHHVVVYDSLLYGVDGLLFDFLYNKFRVIRGDVRDKSKLTEACKGVDAVVHLAALVGYPICKKDERLAFEINVGGVRALTGATDAPIVFASTGSCYGNLEEVCREDSPLEPKTIYGQTKAMAEQALQERGDYVIYRFATGYGVSPRLRLDLLINDFCYRAVRDHNLIVYERKFRRTFIHVYDMARAFVFALENFDKIRNQIFNVGSEEMNLSKQHVAEYIRKKVPFYLHYADVGHDEDQRDYEVSYEKMRSFGFSPLVSLERGVDQLIRLFQVFELPPRYSNV